MIRWIVLLTYLVMILILPARAESSNWHQILMKSTEFADGQIGEGPEPSRSYVAYREALLEPSKITQHEIDTILIKGTAEGKLYAACLSYYAHTARNQTTEREHDLKKLVNDNSTVHYRSGCRGTNSTVGEVAKSLLKDKHFINFTLDDLSVIKKTGGVSDPFLRLSKATRLESSVIGEGSKSSLYAYFKEACQLPIKSHETEIHWLKSQGTPAGKLYACFIALNADENSGIDMFRQLVDDKTAVQYQSGCEVETMTVGSIAREVVSKHKFWDFQLPRGQK